MGANRWKHLSKIFVNQGYDITILTVKRGEIPFEYKNFDIRYIQKFGFYRLYSKKFKNFFLNSIWGQCLNLIRSFFWYDDEAQFMRSNLNAEISKLIVENSRIVLIATGHPFQANRFAAEIKMRYSNRIILIQDFRDPWLANPFKRYRFSFQKHNISKWQHIATSQSDENVYVTKGLMKLMEVEEGKGVVIENGHSSKDPFPSRSQKKYIIHAGTLANGRDNVAESFFRLCKDKPEVLGGRTVIFYGRVSFWLFSKYRDLFKSKIFVLKGTVSQEILNNELLKANFALQFNAKEYPYLVSTKIYEYASKGLPTLSINYGGEIEDIIQLYGIGESVRPQDSKIEEGINEITTKDYTLYLRSFSHISSFENRAKQYTDLINKLYFENNS